MAIQYVSLPLIVLAAALLAIVQGHVTRSCARMSMPWSEDLSKTRRV